MYLYVSKRHLAKKVELAEPLGEPPFGHFQRFYALAFYNLKFCNFGRSNTTSRYYSVIHHLLLSIVNLIYFLRSCNIRTLSGQMAIQQLAKWTWQYQVLHFSILSNNFVPFCKLMALLCSSIYIP